MAYVDQQSRSLPSIAGVALAHVAIGGLLLTGLAGVVIQRDDKPLVTYPVDPDPAPPPPHHDRLPKARQPKSPGQAEKPTDPVDRTVATPAGPSEWILDKGPRIEPLPPFVPTLTAGDATTAATAKGNKAGWFREDDYPSSALRDGAEGTVTISVAIDADGRVASCSVTGSSGNAALDAATCRLYPRRARYAPARDADGSPIAATLTDRVTWQIPR